MQTLDAEQKKLQLGASTIYNVILAERDLVTAESNLVTAEAAYAKAKVELDRSTGQILYNNNISMDEAVKGIVSRPPSRIRTPRPLRAGSRSTAAAVVRAGSPIKATPAPSPARGKAAAARTT